MSDLVAGYDLVIFDLDGVLYLVDQAIPGAVEATGRLRTRGIPAAFVTNNASRRVTDVAALLTSLGIVATEDEVETSARVTARLAADTMPPGRAVLVVGAPALAEEFVAVGLRPVSSADEEPVAVVQGYGPDVGWRQLAEASIAIRAGASWLATNGDRTLPSVRGPLPGNGALVAALATALGREPDRVVGKPNPALFERTAHQRGATRPLVIGDRLDTDIEGANRAGMDSLFVLTGVHGAADLLAADTLHRPTHIAADLSGLFEPPSTTRVVGGDPDSRAQPVPNAWVVDVREERWTLTGDGSAVAALRALCAASWADRPRPVEADGPAAVAALKALHLPT